MKTNRQILFSAGEGGYHVARIPGIVQTAGGVLVVAVEARHAHCAGAKVHGDYRDQDILIRRSRDGGATWTPAQVVISHAAFGPGPMHNFMMIPARDGRLHAVVVFDYQRLFRLHSDNDGTTWSQPAEITPLLQKFNYDVKAFGTGCGHGIQLKSGRLLVPVWFSDNSHSAHRPSDVATIWSDNGITWQAGETVCRTTETYRWPSEAAAAELPDGQVVINLRNESNARRRLIATSPDGVSGWSTARFVEELVEPVCQGSMIWSPSAGGIVFANPDTLKQSMTPAGGRKSDRKNLTLQVSRDLGKTWDERRVIEPGPAGYSDLYDLGDGRLMVVFECGALGDMHSSASVAVESVPLPVFRERE